MEREGGWGEGDQNQAVGTLVRPDNTFTAGRKCTMHTIGCTMHCTIQPVPAGTVDGQAGPVRAVARARVRLRHLGLVGAVARARV